MTFALGLVVPGRPHPLLAPDQNPGWRRLRAAFDTAAARVAEVGADLLVVFSTQWVSVIGHQVQADPSPEWTQVDQDFFELGTMRYQLRIDAAMAERTVDAMRRRGLHARAISYRGFPIDTGSVVALTLLDPHRAIPAIIVSCNTYSDRNECLVLGKAVADAVREAGRRAVAVAVTSLSNRMHTGWIDPAEDRIASQKDDEWNRKLLEILGEGRLEDTSQLQRDFARQAHGDSKGKAFWWLASVMGQHNRYRGEVLAYEPIWGTGAAIVTLSPRTDGGVVREYDEDDVEVHRGERGILQQGGEKVGPATGEAAPAAPLQAPAPADRAPAGAPGAPDQPPAPSGPCRDDARLRGVVRTETAARPVGAYAHARRVGDLLFLAGVGPRSPGTDEIPGGPTRDAEGRAQDYDVAAQTRSVLRNVRAILAAAGARDEDILDVTVFLTDMRRDFPVFNRVWAEELGKLDATRTTIEVGALPTPIAVEFKVVARAPREA